MKYPKKLIHFLSSVTLISLGLQFNVSTQAATFRSIDGSGNNLENPTWGKTHTQLLRLLPAAYDDGISSPAGSDRPSARLVSNQVSHQSQAGGNSFNVSDWFWQWGQFVDHDIDLTESHQPAEAFNVQVPVGDRWFDPFETGVQTIRLSRSEYDPNTGTSLDNPRQQVNQITAYLDGSMIYGSDAERAAEIRANDGTGKLKTSPGNLMHFNTAGFANANPVKAPSDSLFLAGDVRANEQVGLIAVHTLFVREHNRLAEQIAADPNTPTEAEKLGLSVDDYIYETARKLVGAKIQIITYNEYLPLLLGSDGLSPYQGYDETVNASISNEFAHAAFRVGHTQVSPTLDRIDPQTGASNPMALREGFFTTQPILEEGIDSLLLGLASQPAQEIDPLIADDLRNFLFGPPGAGGFDLASLNIQRGRDHGLPSYNATRLGLGLNPAASFADITSNLEFQTALAEVYETVDQVDLWIGGLAEDTVSGSMVGEVFQAILADQFLRLRDGDRFFYQNDADLHPWMAELETVTLAEVIRDNSTVTSIQDQAFLVTQDVPESSNLLALVGILGLIVSWKHRRVK